jgi:hypothetical protein
LPPLPLIQALSDLTYAGLAAGSAIVVQRLRGWRSRGLLRRGILLIACVRDLGADVAKQPLGVQIARFLQQRECDAETGE